VCHNLTVKGIKDPEEVVLRKQLEYIFQVQTIDTNIMNAERMQQKFNEEASQSEKEVIVEQEKLQQAQERLLILEKEHRDHEQALKSLEDQKKKMEERMLSIKTNKEYQAAMKETEKIKAAVSKKEDNIILTMDKVESAKTEVAAEEEELKKAKAVYDEKRREQEGDLQAYLEDVKQQESKRDLLVKEIEPDLYSDYLRLQKVRHGIAVAVAEDEQCMGCSMKIPPQLYNEAIYGEKIVTCPHCHRILYIHLPDESNETAL
jgi:predicted  nucleic acid-binding Zn-ribbon protein